MPGHATQCKKFTINKEKIPIVWCKLRIQGSGKITGKTEITDAEISKLLSQSAIVNTPDHVFGTF